MSFQIAYMEVTQNRVLRQREVVEIVQHIHKGRFAVLPTETGPMLACNALDEHAVDMLFSLKWRSHNNPIHVALPDITNAEKYIVPNACARRVMELLLPGPLTVICPKTAVISDELVANTGNLGIRVPDCPPTLLVCAAAGVPLTATSLNVSGAPAGESIEATLAQLNWIGDNIVYCVNDVSQKVFAQPSTVVRFLEEFTPEILREGPVTSDKIMSAMRVLSIDDISDWG